MIGYIIRLFGTQFLVSVFLSALLHNYLEMGTGITFWITLAVNVLIVPSFISPPEISNEQK